MSGFVAVASRQSDSKHALHLTKMSHQIAHRGDLVEAAVFSPHSACEARYREKSGFSVDRFSDDEFSIVFDGLIRDQEALAEECELANSDGVAQFILAGFRKFGDDWFARLDGSFALMITNLRSSHVILVRDRFAHRPLYFGHFSTGTWVATEIKALLLAPGYQKALNKEKLSANITYGFTSGPQTLFSGIYKVVPGFIVKVDAQGKQLYVDYYSPTVAVNHGLSLDEGKEFVLSAVKKNVQHYVDACPDVGVTLSGGIDSALLAHMTHEVSNGGARAVNFGATSWAEDESSAARDLAGRIGMKFAGTMVSPQDDLLGALRRIVWALEEPTRFENAVALDMMSRDSIGKCSALMTGEGADNIFGGRGHLTSRRLSRILRLPRFLRTVLRSLPIKQIPVRQLKILANYLDWDSVRDMRERDRANCLDLVPGTISPPPNDIVALLATDMSRLTPEMQYAYQKTREESHCWVERMDKIAAASGLECFHAYESNKLFDFGLNLPPNLLNNGRTSKPIMRALAADLFDESVACGKKKQLAVPFLLWLNESRQLRDAVLKLKKTDSRMREYLDNAVVDKYLDLYEREGATDKSVAVPIFRMLTFEIWLDLFF